MTTRPPAVAGTFYEGTPERLRAQVDACFAANPPAPRKQRFLGAVVPHACTIRRVLSDLDPDAVEALREFLGTRQVIDVLKTYPAKWTAQALVKALRPLTPRMYSIASSPAVVEEEVHLTLANVAYEHEGEARWGAASNFLSQLTEGEADTTGG